MPAPHSLPPPPARAFTLVELLVAIAIVSVLAALASPSLSDALVTARINKSSQNLRQLGMLASQFAGEHDDYLPVQNIADTNFGWLHALYPIAYGTNFPDFVPSATGANLKGTIFYSPMLKASEGAPLRSYGYNEYLTTDATTWAPLKRSTVKTSETLLIADCLNRSNVMAVYVAYRNRGKALVCFVDGHVAMLGPTEIAPKSVDTMWSGQ